MALPYWLETCDTTNGLVCPSPRIFLGLLPDSRLFYIRSVATTILQNLGKQILARRKARSLYSSQLHPENVVEFGKHIGLRCRDLIGWLQAPRLIYSSIEGQDYLREWYVMLATWHIEAVPLL